MNKKTKFLFSSTLALLLFVSMQAQAAFVTVKLFGSEKPPYPVAVIVKFYNKAHTLILADGYYIMDKGGEVKLKIPVYTEYMIADADMYANHEFRYMGELTTYYKKTMSFVNKDLTIFLEKKHKTSPIKEGMLYTIGCAIKYVNSTL